MINYSCDLCGNKSGKKIFRIPVAATFIDGEPCDLVPVEMNLCNKCKSHIYKAIAEMIPDNKLKELNKLALNIKMDKI